jgi:hypothetical protein
MLVGKVSMSAIQKRYFVINYEWLALDQHITEAVISVSPDDGKFTATNVTIDADTDRVQFLASGNGVVSDGDEYTATVIVTTSDSPAQVNDDCIKFRIENCCQ